jgi:superfamily II DNA/RNA helicase
LLDLVDHNALRLGGLQTLVLDEADRLLDLGFADELARIFELLPLRRQNLLFSATFPPDVHAMAEHLLRDPVRIEASCASTSAPLILQRAIHVDSARRTQLLRHLIQAHDWTQTLVFVATRYATEHVALKLRRAGINAAALHAELGPWARSQALTNFKARRLSVLVATDLAARGIDIELLPVVVNYDLPRSTHDYLHRIGRTGRAGAQGVAVSFISPATEAHFRLIERRHRFELARETIEGFEVTDAAPSPATSPEAGHSPAAIPGGTGGIKGKRKSKKDRLRAALGKPSASD